MARAWCVVLVSLPALAGADVKLLQQKDKGMEFLAPPGWQIDLFEDASKAVITDGATHANLTIQALIKKDVSIESWVKMMTGPDAKPKAAGGWTCAEGLAADKSRSATCGQARDDLLLFASLSADPATFKKLGGLKLVQKVAASAKGFKAPSAGD